MRPLFFTASTIATLGAVCDIGFSM